MKVDISLNGMSNSIADIVSKQTKSLGRNMNDVMLLIEDEAVQLAPYDLGQLRNERETTLKMDSNEIIGEIAFTSEHAVYVHQGTGVYAKDGDGRKTPWKYKAEDGYVYKTEGQKSNPFLEKAVDKNIEKITVMLSR